MWSTGAMWHHANLTISCVFLVINLLMCACEWRAVPTHRNTIFELITQYVLDNPRHALQCLIYIRLEIHFTVSINIWYNINFNARHNDHECSSMPADAGVNKCACRRFTQKIWTKKQLSFHIMHVFVTTHSVQTHALTKAHKIRPLHIIREGMVL